MKGDPEQVVQMAFSLQEMADLRHLLSIATWIRAEQLHPENPVIEIRPEIPDATDPESLPRIKLIQETLDREICTFDLSKAQDWWKIFHKRLEANGCKLLTASWMQKKEPKT